jgi:hypothetical protein
MQVLPAAATMVASSNFLREETIMRNKIFELGGIAASVVLIAFGIGTIVVAADGRDTVRSSLAAEHIVGTEDSTIPGQLVDTGAEARAFADVMRAHTLKATGGLTYAEMDRFLDAQGNPTSDEKLAAKTPAGQPVENGLRNMWVTETALTTALQTAYFGEQVALFSMIVGVALLLVGTGFLVLTLTALRGVRRERAERAAPTAKPAIA